jgi:hypothetical protein
MLRFQYFAALPTVSRVEWPSSSDMDHILFTEDLADPGKLQIKLQLVVQAPTPEAISEDIYTLHHCIASRYVGVASFISLKTPQEGLQQHRQMLGRVKDEYVRQLDKVFRMGKEQQAIFNSHLENFSNFGGHGSG